MLHRLGMAGRRITGWGGCVAMQNRCHVSQIRHIKGWYRCMGHTRDIEGGTDQDGSVEMCKRCSVS